MENGEIQESFWAPQVPCRRAFVNPSFKGGGLAAPSGKSTKGGQHTGTVPGPHFCYHRIRVFSARDPRAPQGRMIISRKRTIYF